MMSKKSNKWLVSSMAALMAGCFALAPIAEARGGDRAGGGGGGAARANAGGGAARTNAGSANRGNRQIDNSNIDSRANNVRSGSVNNVNSSRTNVNNVNANRNVNVNVDGNNNCCGGGWDNDYHPIAAAAVVTATVAAIGSMVRTVPSNCVPVNYGGVVYQQCGNTWYQPQGSQYMVVNPPY